MYVVHLRDRELDALPAAATSGRNVERAVVALGDPARVHRIDPDGMVVAAWRRSSSRQSVRKTTIQTYGKAAEKIDLVLIVRCHREMHRVIRPSNESAVVAHHTPRASTVVRPPQCAGLGLPSAPRHAIAGLDESIDALGVARRDCHHDSAHRPCRQSAAGEPLPGEPPVDRPEESTSRAAALASPRLDLELP